MIYNYNTKTEQIQYKRSRYMLIQIWWTVSPILFQFLFPRLELFAPDSKRDVTGHIFPNAFFRHSSWKLVSSPLIIIIVITQSKEEEEEGGTSYSNLFFHLTLDGPTFCRGDHPDVQTPTLLLPNRIIITTIIIRHQMVKHIFSMFWEKGFCQILRGNWKAYSRKIPIWWWWWWCDDSIG